MTSQEFEPADTNDILSDVDKQAISHIQEKQEDGAYFTKTRARWLARVFAGGGDPNFALQQSRIEYYGTGHTLELLDDIRDIDIARNAQATLGISQRLQIGLYLTGMDGTHIRRLYAQCNDPNYFSLQRTRFVGSLEDARLPSSKKEAIQAVRERVMGRIALALSPIEAPRVRDSAPDLTNLFTRELDIYPAEGIVRDVESRYIDSQILGESDRGLLLRHFFDIDNELTKTERGRIGRAVRNLQSLLNTRLRTEHVPKARQTLYESLSLLHLLVGDSAKLAQTRAAHINKIRNAPFLDNVDIDAVVQKENRQLDIAFSWLFAQPKPAVPTFMRGTIEDDSADE